MLNIEDYEVLKNSFIESQRLFDKLSVVSNNFNNIDFDESGLYQDDEDTCTRHWLKLSSKIVNGLSEVLPQYEIELKKSYDLGKKEVDFNLISKEDKSEIKVDYSEDGALNIVQVS